MNALTVNPRIFRPLNDQEMVFVAEYLATLSIPKTAAKMKMTTNMVKQWLLANGPRPNVAFAIKDAVQQRINRLQITPDRILAELAKIGFSNAMDYMSLDEYGQPYIDLSALNRDSAAAIQEFTVSEYKEGRGEDAREVKQIKIKLYDKKGALIALGKQVGLFGPLYDPETDEPGDKSEKSSKQNVNFNINFVPQGAQIAADGKIIQGELFHAPKEIEDLVPVNP